MVLDAKIEENHEEGASKNYVFFACVFESLFEEFGEGSGFVGHVVHGCVMDGKRSGTSPRYSRSYPDNGEGTT